MPLSGKKWYPPNKLVFNGKNYWHHPKKLYGDDRRVVDWGVPLITYWNRVPIYLKWEWQNATVWAPCPKDRIERASKAKPQKTYEAKGYLGYVKDQDDSHRTKKKGEYKPRYK